MIINLPWAKGDRFYVEGAYTEGAPSYAGWSGGVQGGYATFSRFNGGNVAAAWAFELDLRQPRVDRRRDRPSADHVVDDRRRHRALLDPGSAFVGVRQLQLDHVQRHGADAVLLVSAEPDPHAAVVLLRPALSAFAGCNPDFNVWNVGTRTIWNPVPNLDVGLEIMYTKLETKHDPALVAFNFAGAGGRAVGLYAAVERGRVHRPVPHPAQLLAMIA